MFLMDGKPKEREVTYTAMPWKNCRHAGLGFNNKSKFVLCMYGNGDFLEFRDSEFMWICIMVGSNVNCKLKIEKGFLISELEFKEREVGLALNNMLTWNA